MSEVYDRLPNIQWSINVYICIYVPRTQMTHMLEDLTLKMEGQLPKIQVSWVLGIDHT